MFGRPYHEFETVDGTFLSFLRGKTIIESVVMPEKCGSADVRLPHLITWDESDIKNVRMVSRHRTCNLGAHEAGWGNRAAWAVA